MLYKKLSNIKGAGIGVFAFSCIKKNTRLGKYEGISNDFNMYSKLRNKNYIWQINDNLFVDGNPKLKKNNILSYVNGAKSRCQKRKINVYAYLHKNNIYYKTLTNVKKGEEIIVDYGDRYW
jgi:SET domain-containing protein